MGAYDESSHFEAFGKPGPEKKREKNSYLASSEHQQYKSPEWEIQITYSLLVMCVHACLFVVFRSGLDHDPSFRIDAHPSTGVLLLHSLTAESLLLCIMFIHEKYN